MNWKRFIVLLLLVICLQHTISFAHAEQNKSYAPFASLYRESAALLFLDNGNMLFALPASSGSISSLIARVVCVDQYGTLQWEINLPNIMENMFLSLARIEKDCFALLGRQTDTFWHAVIIGPDGDYHDEFVLPEGSYAPMLTSTGIYYTTAGNANAAPQLWRIDWHKQATQIEIPQMASINIWSKSKHDPGRNLCIFYRDVSGIQRTALTHINENALTWLYDLGNFPMWTCTDWTENDLGGITAAVQHSMDDGTAQNYIVCLDENGHEIWGVSVCLGDFYISPHIIQQSANGEYDLLGSISRVDTTLDSRNFNLRIAADGEYISSGFKAVAGDCVQYNGEVYVVSSPFDTPQLVPYEDLPDISAGAFKVEKR